MTEDTAQHSILGASGMDRWSQCPASVSLSTGLNSLTSSFAAEGQGAHALTEHCLVTGEDPQLLIDAEFPSDLGPIKVDAEMADAAEMYLDLCATVSQKAKFNAAEIRVNVNALWGDDTPPADMFGTADYACWGTPDRRLTVIDFKYGKGVAVDIATAGGLNPQLQYYALGVLLGIRQDGEQSPLWVDIYICQPRADHPSGPIRRATLSVLDLLAWGHDVLKPAAEACFADNPKAVVGPGCRWCPAKGRCPALRQVAQETARVEFDGLPPLPIDLDDTELGAVLDKSEIIRAFLDGVRAEASGRLDRGGRVTGWKLVQKRAVRKWLDEDQVFRILEDAGHQNDKIRVTKIKSPAQMEKVLKDDQETLGRLTDLISKASSGVSLVRDLTPGQIAAAADAAADFDEIPE